MSKNNYLLKKIKSIFLSINSFLLLYLSKLNLKNKKNKLSFKNNAFKAFFIILILIISYLSIPSFYDDKKVENFIKNHLVEKNGLQTSFLGEINYSFLPKPHFMIKKLKLVENEKEISLVKELKVFISLKNFFSLKKMDIEKIIFYEATFNFNKRNFNFIKKFLNEKNRDSVLILKNSNIFFRDQNGDLLFIKKILKNKFFYDKKKKIYTVTGSNEIFNLKYSLDIKLDRKNKIINTKILSKDINLNLVNEFNYQNEKGIINLSYLNKKKVFDYNLTNNTLLFSSAINEKKQNPEHIVKLNFKPFFLNFNSNLDKLDISDWLSPESLLLSFLKSQLLYNKNLSVYGDVNIKKILNFNNLNNFFLEFKIEKGLIDFSNISFIWNDIIKFNASNNLLLLQSNDLVIDGRIIIEIENLRKIFQFFQIPKKFRKSIDMLEFDFDYNFGQEEMNIFNIKIDDKINNQLNMFFEKNNLKFDDPGNKIYFKRFINDAFKAYSG